MAAKSNLKNMVLCLSAVCLFCSAILGSVYALTKEPIRVAAEAKEKASIMVVLPEGGEISEVKAAGDLEYYECVKDSAVVAYAVKSTTVGFSGRLVVMVGVLPDGTIYNTDVIDQSETPGMGAKCVADEAFTSQWKNFPADGRLTVRKDGGDIDAITASTITSRAYALAVSQARDLVKSFGEE